MEEVKYPLYHAGLLGCDKIAFFTTEKLIPGISLLSAENIILLNGEHPLNYIDEIRCGSCGLPVGLDLSYSEEVRHVLP